MASTISTTQLKPIYTTLLAARYDELMKTKATGWFRSMFKDNITKVRYPSYEVRRGTEKVAIDVIRGHQGIRTQITRSTQKLIDAFYFNLFFDATELDCYWNLFGSTSTSTNVMTEFVNGVDTHNKANQDMIDRAYELMCSQILEFGTCTSFADGSVVDFKRKAGSMVDKGAGNYWATGSVNPYNDVQAGCEWIRKNGLYTGSVFNMTMGTTAWQDFISNAIVLARNDVKMFKLDSIVAPEAKIEGQTYMGTISAGPYTVHLWQYDQYYDHPTTGVKTAYMNAKKVYITPVQTEFQIIYAATPQVVTPGAATLSLVAGKVIHWDYLDRKAKTHEFHSESCGLPVPLAIDTIYSLQVVAA